MYPSSPWGTCSVKDLEDDVAACQAQLKEEEQHQSCSAREEARWKTCYHQVKPLIKGYYRVLLAFLATVARIL